MIAHHEEVDGGHEVGRHVERDEEDVEEEKGGDLSAPMLYNVMKSSVINK